MRFPSSTAAVLAAAAIAAAATGCGFDEKLTSRGFIEAGDGLCDQAIGRGFIAVRRTPGGAAVLDADGINALAAGHAGIADGLRALDLREEDEALRDAMVKSNDETASQLRGIAADAAAGDPGAPTAAIAALDALRPFAAQLRDYGFRICGGRDPV